MTNLTPIGNEADILRESKIPSQTGPKPASNPVSSVIPPQGGVGVGAPELSQAPSATLESFGGFSSNAPAVDPAISRPKVGMDINSPDPSIKPYSEPVSNTSRPGLPQPIKRTEYKPFSYKLPVLNYILSVIFFIISAVALVYYAQLFFVGTQNIPAVDSTIYGIQTTGFGLIVGSTDYGAIAGYFAIASTLLLALTLLTTTRLTLYLSVFASLFGTAYWGYALSFSISKTSIDTVFSGLGIYILLFYLFMFSVTLTAFIHTVKSSIRT